MLRFGLLECVLLCGRRASGCRGLSGELSVQGMKAQAVAGALVLGEGKDSVLYMLRGHTRSTQVAQGGGMPQVLRLPLYAPCHQLGRRRGRRVAVLGFEETLK